jgi:hypothetical protein
MVVMKIDLAFGKTGITVDLPGGFRYRVLEARSAKPLADWRSSLESALDRPIAGLPLAELARGKRTAAISICDITRPAPNRLTLPPLLRRLEEAGIRREADSSPFRNHHPKTPQVRPRIIHSPTSGRAFSGSFQSLPVSTTRQPRFGLLYRD